MGSKQKRKVSKSRIYQLYKRDIDAIGGLIYPDEKFLPVKGESAIWVSNYARLLSKRKGKPKILKTVFQKGYQRVTLPQAMYGKKEKHMYYLHNLVAQAFCDIPSWVKPGDKIETHHISRINHDKDIVGINFAKNLMYVPRKLHKAIDSIVEIDVKQGQKWVVMDYDKAAEFYGISPYDFINAIGNEKYQKPTAKRGKYQYYNKEVGEETPVQINVRIVRESTI